LLAAASLFHLLCAKPVAATLDTPATLTERTAARAAYWQDKDMAEMCVREDVGVVFVLL
jgi:hypothetical protein